MASISSRIKWAWSRNYARRRWPGSSFRHLMYQTTYYFMMWFFFEVMAAIFLPIVALGIAVYLVSVHQPTLRELIEPRDLLILSAGLLFARMPDIFEMEERRRRAATLMFFIFMMVALFGVLTGTMLHASEMLAPLYRHTEIAWPVSMIYMLIVILLIAIVWVFKANVDEAEKHQESDRSPVRKITITPTQLAEESVLLRELEDVDKLFYKELTKTAELRQIAERREAVIRRLYELNEPSSEQLS
jgi:hypothetical protein